MDKETEYIGWDRKVQRHFFRWKIVIIGTSIRQDKTPADYVRVEGWMNEEGDPVISVLSSTTMGE